MKAADYLLSVRRKLLLRTLRESLVSSFVPLLLFAAFALLLYAAAFRSFVNFSIPPFAIASAPFVFSAIASIMASRQAFFKIEHEAGARELRFLETMPLPDAEIVRYFSTLGCIRAIFLSVVSAIAGLPFLPGSGLPDAWLAVFPLLLFSLAFPLLCWTLTRSAAAFVARRSGKPDFPVIQEEREESSRKKPAENRRRTHPVYLEFTQSVSGKDVTADGRWLVAALVLAFTVAAWLFHSGSADTETVQKALTLLALAVSAGGGMIMARRASAIRLPFYRTLPVRFSRLLLSDLASFARYAGLFISVMPVAALFLFPAMLPAALILPPAIAALFWLTSMRYRTLRFAAGIVSFLWTIAIAVVVLVNPWMSVLAAAPVLTVLFGARRSFYRFHLEGASE